MNESLSEDELAELVRRGRINSSRSAARRRQQTNTSVSINSNNKSAKTQTRSRDISTPKPVLPKSSSKELDPEWLSAEKEKAEHNIVAQRQDKLRREEMREASKF